MKKKNRYKILIINIIIIFFVIIFIRLFVFEIYYISGNSMNDTLKDGDVVLINKIAYGGRLPTSIAEIPWLNFFTLFLSNKKNIQLEKGNLSKSRFVHFSTIKRGDIIVINDPWNYSNYLVKRCIAIAGDSIWMNYNSDLLINGKISEEYHLVKKLYHVDYSKSEISKTLTFSQLVDSLYIPYYEDRIEKRASVKNIYLTSPQKRLLESNIDAELIEPDNCCSFNQMLVLPSRNKNTDNSPNNTLNYYFVMGDNRCSSTDSRHFGFVPENLLIGKIEFVLFSLSKNKELRKKRIFLRY